jgi:hypothetical protein
MRSGWGGGGGWGWGWGWDWGAIIGPSPQRLHATRAG